MAWSGRGYFPDEARVFLKKKRGGRFSRRWARPSTGHLGEVQHQVERFLFSFTHTRSGRGQTRKTRLAREGGCPFASE